MREVDVVVIGAGQAGLSAGYHLQRRGFVPWRRASRADRTYLILDAEDAPGGAWRHRWETLTMATVNGIHELPGYPVPEVDRSLPSREVLPEYFARYEEYFGLDVQRPVRVRSVSRPSPEPSSSPEVRLVVVTESMTDTGTDTDTDTGSHTDTDAGADTDTDMGADTDTDMGSYTDTGAAAGAASGETWTAGHVINATGTWSRPFWPHYPGRATFRGRQLHVHDYGSAEEFVGKRVVIVGSGISATQLLEEISRVTDTLWVTRTPPEWSTDLSPEILAAAVRRVEDRVREGLPSESVVRVTGMHRTPWVERADARGALVRHPMFTRIEPGGVRMPDGTLELADVILWATGFRPAVAHLAPLGLRTPQGGIRVADGRSIDEPRLFLIGYGPSQSTVGANRAGRDAVIAIVREFGRSAPS